MTVVPRLTGTDRRAIKLLLLISTTVFGLVLVGQFSYSHADYQGHVGVAMRLVERGEIDNPHILFNLIIVALALVLPFLGYVFAGVIASIFAYLFGAVVVYMMVRPAVPGRGRRASLLTLLIALCLLIVAPISIVTLPQHNLYGGYIAVNALHNPTIILLKPFALLVFALALQLLQGVKPLGNRTTFVTALLVILCGFSKPNYLMCLLPAAIVITAYRLFRHDSVEARTLTLGIITPTIAVLAVQYVHAYFFSEFIGDTSIVFAPLAGVLLYAPTIAWIVLKFLLSVAFPLCVCISKRRLRIARSISPP
jgi:hypothetical protein